MKNKGLSIVIVVFLVAIFSSWINPFGTLSAGDWPYLYQKASQSFSFSPAYYKEYWGLGETKLVFTALETYYQWSAKAVSLIIPWEVSEKVFWFVPFLLISFFSAKKLTKSLLGGFIYTTNTYILMVVSGGQMGVALSYAIVPLVIHSWLNLIEDPGHARALHFYRAVVVGLLFSFQVFFDPRIALISFVIAALYYGYQLLFIRKKVAEQLRSIVVSFLVPILVTLFLHSFWILPMIIFRVGASDHDSSGNYLQGAIEFFSFSDFSHMLSLLHPNWPENIFGKVYFLQPEFLLIPILVFSLLLFLQKKTGAGTEKEKRKIGFFMLLGILGVFLSKGVNDPFGIVYQWLFSYVPGFVMFRDPTKFMLLIALSYSLLIPRTICVVSEVIEPILQRRRWRISASLLQQLLFVVVVLLWSILIHQAVTRDISGTLHSRVVPESYRSLAAFLTKEPSFSRVLWVPTHQRFGYYGNDHPALSAREFFHTSDTKKILQLLNKPETISLLRESAVRYVVVPFDSQEELFLTDRKFDANLYSSLRKKMQEVNGLKRVASFRSMDVYEISSVKDHIWLDPADPISSDTPIVWSQLSPVRYSVSVDGHKGDTVVFSESFSRFWKVREKQNTREVSSYKKILIGYSLQREGQSKFEFYHVFESIMPVGIGLSLLSAGVIVAIVFTLRRKVG